MRAELAQDGFDLPELADTMEEADARATASTYLFALRGVGRQIEANDAEFTVLQNFNQARHIERQDGLIRQKAYLRGVVHTLFGFMHTGKKKSLNLIGGRVGMRAQTDELVVEDDEAVIAWAKEHRLGDLVRIKYVVDRSGLRKYVDGSIAADFGPPPGVKLEQRDDQFYATPAE
jgi:hypothetical protein